MNERSQGAAYVSDVSKVISTVTPYSHSHIPSPYANALVQQICI